MSKKFWIGIDGGGTKTTAVLGDGTGHLLAAVKGSSGNLTAISPQNNAIGADDFESSAPRLFQVVR